MHRALQISSDWRQATCLAVSIQLVGLSEHVLRCLLQVQITEKGCMPLLTWLMEGLLSLLWQAKKHAPASNVDFECCPSERHTLRPVFMPAHRFG